MKSPIEIYERSDSHCPMATVPKLLSFIFLLCTAIPLGAQDAAPVLKPLNQRGVVKLKTIAGDFATNEVAAIAKYSGRRITVIGRVAHLSQGSSENKVLVVTLQDASASLPAVKGDFLTGSIPEYSGIEISQDGSSATLVQRDSTGRILGQKNFLNADSIIGLKGNYKELKVGNVILTDCKIIPKERLHELRNELEKKQSTGN